MGSVSKVLRPLTTSKSFGLLHSFTPITVIDPGVASNPYHPLSRKVLERLKAEENRTPRLIVNAVATKKKVSKHSAVRNKAVRRVREAAYEVLKEKGYGKEGEVLKATGNDTIKGKEPLVGTLSFWVTMDSVLTGWGDLKKEVGMAIDKFITLGQRGRGVQKKRDYGTGGGYIAGGGRPGSAIESRGEGLYQKKPPRVYGGGRLGAVEGGGQNSYQKRSLGEGYGSRRLGATRGGGQNSHQRVVVEGVKRSSYQGKPSGKNTGEDSRYK